MNDLERQTKKLKLMEEIRGKKSQRATTDKELALSEIIQILEETDYPN
jgi:hypothetical protein